jgi:uncharacterized tellurite resistance protein B-like protein
METIDFNRLLFQTACCCMVSDGDIAEEEVNLLKNIFENSPVFNDLNFQDEINSFIAEVNEKGKDILKSYFLQLSKAELTEDEALSLIDVALRTINADEIVEYAEIKFFKNIRFRLKISDEKILERFPDIEQFLEEDIVTESFLECITNQYFESAALPQLNLILD